ncbi:MAG: cell division protein FtsQ/DivIB [Flavipsychrobacter sp.]
MAKRRKISVRRVFQVLLTLVATTACVMGILSAARIEDNKRLTGVDIQIVNGKKYHFLDEQDVKRMLVDNRHIDINQTPVGKLDIHVMENIITANPWVGEAQVYVDNNRLMHVNVTQRVPVARIFEANGNSYYVDTTLSDLPLSEKYVYYTTVVTNMPELKNDSVSRSLKAQVLKLVRFVENDTFWNAQVSQIIVDSNCSFEVVPVLGNQRILVGDTSRLVEKFDNLFLFYKNILNRIGWDKYQTLDLRYKDQVVASPALPWKAPVDKALSNMNWVKSIIDMGAKKEGIDTALKITPPAIAPALVPKQQQRTAAVVKQTDKKIIVKTNNKTDIKQKRNK